MKQNLENSSVDDAELIRRQMQGQGMQSLTNPTQKENQKALESQKCAKSKKETFEKCYEFCLKVIEDKTVDGNFVSGSDDVPPMPAEKFKINEDTKEMLSNLDYWKDYLENPTRIQLLVEYSDDMLLGLYHIANICYENKQHQDAIRIYSFLCLLNPFISSFWNGLGLGLEENEQLTDAIEAYENAAQTAPSKFTPYLGMIRCSERLHNRGKITEQLTKACENPDLQQEAKEALEYLSSLSKIGG